MALAYEVEDFLASFNTVEKWGGRWREDVGQIFIEGYVVFYEPLKAKQRGRMIHTVHDFGDNVVSISRLVLTFN